MADVKFSHVLLALLAAQTGLAATDGFSAIRPSPLAITYGGAFVIWYCTGIRAMSDLADWYRRHRQLSYLWLLFLLGTLLMTMSAVMQGAALLSAFIVWTMSALRFGAMVAVWGWMQDRWRDWRASRALTSGNPAAPQHGQVRAPATGWRATPLHTAFFLALSFCAGTSTLFDSFNGGQLFSQLLLYGFLRGGTNAKNLGELLAWFRGSWQRTVFPIQGAILLVASYFMHPEIRQYHWATLLNNAFSAMLFWTAAYACLAILGALIVRSWSRLWARGSRR